MILAGHLLIDNGAGRCTVSPGFVRVDGEQIVEVVTGEIPRQADIGGEQTLISPGFINAHLHLPQFDMIGAHGIPLLSWLSDITFPAELKWEDVNVAREMTVRVVAQLLSKGTTGICAYATVHHEAARAAIEVATEAGLRRRDWPGVDEPRGAASAVSSHEPIVRRGSAARGFVSCAPADGCSGYATVRDFM